MKKNLITASLLLISTSLLYSNNSTRTDATTYKTTSLTTQSGLILQGDKNGLDIIKKNNQTFNLPIFKAKTNLNIYTLVEQSDGKIIIGGNFDTVNGYKIKDIVRLNTDGSVDKGFMSDYSGFNGEVYDIEVLNDDSILVGGYFTELGNNTISKGLLKLTSDGDLNLEYDALNTFDVSIVNDIKIINNKIFIAGTFIKNKNNQNPLLAMDKFGKLDNNFNMHVNKIEGEAYKIASQKDSLVIVGDLTVKDDDKLSDIIKIDINGNIDKHFSVSNLQGFIFDAKYQNNTLILGGELAIKDRQGITKEMNTVILKTTKESKL